MKAYSTSVDVYSLISSYVIAAKDNVQISRFTVGRQRTASLESRKLCKVHSRVAAGRHI